MNPDPKPTAARYGGLVRWRRAIKNHLVFSTAGGYGFRRRRIPRSITTRPRPRDYEFRAGISGVARWCSGLISKISVRGDLANGDAAAPAAKRDYTDLAANHRTPTEITFPPHHGATNEW